MTWKRKESEEEEDAEESEPRWVRALRADIHHGFTRILQGERYLMSQQDELNTYVQRLTDATTSIKDEITKLEAQNPALDLTGLKDAVSGVEGLEPPVVTPPPVMPPNSGPPVNPGQFPPDAGNTPNV